MSRACAPFNTIIEYNKTMQLPPRNLLHVPSHVLHLYFPYGAANSKTEDTITFLKTLFKQTTILLSSLHPKLDNDINSYIKNINQATIPTSL